MRWSKGFAELKEMAKGAPCALDYRVASWNIPPFQAYIEGVTIVTGHNLEDVLAEMKSHIEKIDSGVPDECRD